MSIDSSCECPSVLSQSKICGVKIRKDTDLSLLRAWAKANGVKNGRLKKILKQIKRATTDPEFSELVWLYPQGSIDPPLELLRVEIETVSDFFQELYTVEALQKSEYTEEDADKIVSEITFGKELTPEERQELVDVVKRRISSFSRHKGDIGYTTLIEHEIDLIDPKPFKIKPYKLSFDEQAAAVAYIQQLLKEGQIQPSKSPFSSPAFLKPKPNQPGLWRLLIDFRKLNTMTRAWSMPLPYMSDLQQKIARFQYFATMDVTSGFYNVPVKPEHRQYTAFNLRNIGLFEWLVMPMGLKNAPATFTRLQQIVFPPLDYPWLEVFIDDLCLGGDSISELANRLDSVLERLSWAGMKLSPKKCTIGVKEVEFLGHVISHGEIKPSPKNVEAIRNLQPPSTIKQLQSVLGLMQYYRTFIPKFSHIARPMTNLLKKEEDFVWNDSCQAAFEFLKECLCSAPILTSYNPDFQLVLDTDYEKHAISAILGQINPKFKREQVIGYASRTLSKTERRMASTQGELAALVFGLRHFSVFLRGRPKFIVRTDHRALIYLKSMAPQTGKLARWLYLIEAEYNIEFQHREGIKHRNADALSRAVADHLDRSEALDDELES